MVLGANLMPLKKGDAESIYRSQLDTPRNFFATYNELTGEGIPGYDEEAVRMLLKLSLEDKLSAPKSQQDFEKFFTKKF
jgi:hypothetical protein